MGQSDDSSWLTEESGLGECESVNDEDNVGTLIKRTVQVDKPYPTTVKLMVSGETSFIQFYLDAAPSKVYSLYIDIGEPEIVFDYLVELFYLGRLWSVAEFLDHEGRVARDPLEFRLKLEAWLAHAPINLAEQDED